MVARRGIKVAVLVCGFLVSTCGAAGEEYGGGTGEPNDPYLVYTPQHMNAIGANAGHWDKHFKLMADIDFSAYSASGFEVIGRLNMRGGRSFSGVFDGNGHTITDFVLRLEEERYGGLFGCVSGAEAEIRNLGLLRPHVAVPAGLGTGALVGRLDGGRLVNCHVVGGAVSGWNQVGGLVGMNEAGTIVNCYAATTVSGANYIGGLVGENHSDAVTHCHAAGHASGLANIGGLLGINYGTLMDCTASGTVAGSTYTGGLIGYNDGGAISDCRTTGRVTGTDAAGGLLGLNWGGTITACHSDSPVVSVERTGGLVGYSVGGAISKCYAAGPVTGERAVGGLAGGIRPTDLFTGAVESSYATGDVSGDVSVGGLIGGFGGHQIVNCYATGTAVGTDYVGGLVGSLGAETITTSYATGTVVGTNHVGGLVGYNRSTDVHSSFWDIDSSGQQTSAGGTGLASDEMMQAETFFGWGGCGDVGTWKIDEGRDSPRLWWENRPGALTEIPSLPRLMRGEGTRSDPFLVETAEQFRLIGLTRCAWDRHFKLMADIDLDPYASDEVCIIGLDFYRGAFAGVFDGNGHTISHFRHTAGESGYVGLFGYVNGPDAAIRNLGLIAPTIDGGALGYTGSLVGYLAEGRIHNCFVKDGSVCRDGLVGGLVGRNRDHVEGCYVTGTVRGNTRVGGLVGRNDGVIAHCYSTSSVSGTSEVGGLVGYTGGRIVDCFATGSVAGEEEAGGLIGGRSGIVTDSFWNIETSGQTSSASGTGIDNTAMQDASVFQLAGWDFFGPLDGPSDIWTFDGDTGHPILWWQVPEAERPELPTFSGGTGTAADPYLVATAEHLTGIGHHPRLMAAHFRLANDIDLGGVRHIPIGGEGVPFTGSFDGDGKTVSNCIVSTTENCRGLFGHVRGTEAIVKNVGLSEVSIDTGWGDYVGALVGALRYGTVSQCHVAGGRLRSDDWIGGLVGYSREGTIVNCTAVNSVSGDDRVGGLVGESESGAIVNSSSESSVYGTTYAGGLVGENGGVVTDCYAAGGVEGRRQYAGGLLGRNYGTVTHCDSAGIITGADYVGGLIGYNSGALTDCSSLSEVSGVEYVGGLVGRHGGGEAVTRCYAAGTIRGGSAVGGLAGQNAGSGVISNCYATGDVAGENRVGGLVGENGDIDSDTNKWPAISQCYFMGRVSGQTDVGGLVGWDAWELAESSFWDVQVSGQHSSAGGKGLTTGQMMTAGPFLAAGWDFMGETENGSENIWWMDEGQDYPRLWWELLDAVAVE